jgi:cell division protein FtsZ
VVPQASENAPVAELDSIEESIAPLFDTPMAEVAADQPTITHVLEWSDETDAFGFELAEAEDDLAIVDLDEDALIPTTEALRNLEVVDFEVITPESSLELEADDAEAEMEFHIVEKPSANIPPITIEEPVFEEQTSLFFDLTIEEVQAPKIPVPQELTSAQIWNLEVIDAEIVAPKPLRQEPAPAAFISEEAPAKRYSLEDYMELEQKLTQAQPEPKEAEVAELPELQFEHKVVEAPVAQASSVEVDPMESPIADLLKARTEERKRQFKEFNYHFNNSLQRIDEIEKEPAYKRQGIALDQNPVEAKLSRTTLSADPNDEDRLRTNNSFLHDNVD